jgi:tetratricopeptide (TPR) repeat protein
MLAKLAIVGVCVVIAAAPAHADDRIAQAKHQVAAADIDYRLGRFGAALDEYTRAYERYPVPPLLFNIGQCHKNLKDYAKAIFFFEGYLRDAPTASNRALVEDLIREARAELDKVPPIVAPAAQPQPPAPPPPISSPPPVAVRPIEPALPQDDRAPGSSRALPIALIGGGIAAVAAGTVLYYYGQKRGPGEMFVYDDTRLLGGTMVVLGGAMVVTGAILWRHPRSAAPVAALGPSAGYLGWAGTF